MKSLFILLIGLQFIFPVFANAKTLKVRAFISLSGDAIDVDLDEVDKEGWRSRTDAYGNGDYDITLTVDEKDLPIKKVAGPVVLKISKFGNIEVGLSLGDADITSSSKILLPKQDKKLISFGQMNFVTSSGNHASGSWSFDAKLTISVKD